MSSSGPRRYLTCTGLYDHIENFDMMIDTKYLYRFLLGNEDTTICGLYRTSFRKMCNETGISRDRIQGCVESLVVLGLITYDNGLVFVPRIPWEQNFHSKQGMKAHCRNIIANNQEIRSDLVGSVNRAYNAFCEHHEEFLFNMDQERIMDEETQSKAKSKAKTKRGQSAKGRAQAEDEDTAEIEDITEDEDTAPKGDYGDPTALEMAEQAFGLAKVLTDSPPSSPSVAPPYDEGRPQENGVFNGQTPQIGGQTPLLPPPHTTNSSYHHHQTL